MAEASRDDQSLARRPPVGSSEIEFAAGQAEPHQAAVDGVRAHSAVEGPTTPSGREAAPASRVRFVLLVLLAAVGACLLAVVIAGYWNNPNDSFAYWIAARRLAAGQPIYATGDAAFAPYAYHYLPPLAQVLAPLTLVVPDLAYVIAYRALDILAVWFLAGRRMLGMLALIAFLPVAVELRFENIHLFIATLLVLALPSRPWLYAVGAIAYLSPGLGILYLVARRRWRDAGVGILVLVSVALASLILNPQLWRDWLTAVSSQSSIVGNSLIPLPYAVRAAVGGVLALIAGRWADRNGEMLLVVAVTVALPGLALSGFAVLAALVPIWRRGRVSERALPDSHGADHG